MEDGANIKGHEEFSLDADAINTDRIHRYFQLAVECLTSPSFVDILLKTREKSTINFAQAVTLLSVAGTVDTIAIVLVKYVFLHGLCIVVFHRISFAH